MKLLTTFIALTFATTAVAQKAPKPSTDSAYGYTAEKPLLLKDGNPFESITYTQRFLTKLRTTDGEKLILISRSSTFNPRYTDKDLERIIKQGGGAMLDRYSFTTPSQKDTFSLYVDIYNKGEIFVPIGLTTK